MTIPRTAFLLAFVIVLAACGRREQALIFDDSVATDWENAANQRDVDALAQLLDENVQLLPPNAPVIEGHGAAKAFYRELLEASAGTTKWDVRDVVVFTGYTYRQGIYETELPNGGSTYGKFIHLWKNHPSGWKLYRAMWSSSEAGTAPVQAPSPASD